MKANNTRADTNDRNATFSESPVSGFSLAWQNVTISNLTATNDAREVQGGSTATFVGINGDPSNNQGLAMRITTTDKVNLTGIWIYYTLTGSLTVPLTVLSSTTASATPTGSVIAQGTVEGTGGGAVWGYVKFNAPATITEVDYVWIVVNASSLSSAQFFNWGYKQDSGGADSHLASAGVDGVGWVSEFFILTPHQYINFLLVLNVLPVDVSGQHVRTYNAPDQVNMYLNATTQIVNNVTRVSNSYHTFVLSANTSITFTVNWTARFEFSQPNAVSTHYIAENALTLWNATFVSGSKPSNPYTWYNRTLKVSPIPSLWTVPDPSSNVTSIPYIGFSFTAGSGSFLITQTGNVNGSGPWGAGWLIRAQSSYSVKGTAASQVIRGLPLTVDISTAPLSPSHCSFTLYNGLGSAIYSRILVVPSTSYSLQVRLNETGVHTAYLFDTWDSGNEVSLNSTLTVAALQPLSNVTITGINQPILWNDAIVNFKFLNNSAGGIAVSPLQVTINGTPPSGGFTYNGGTGVVTATWSTATGGWHSGINYVNITAVSGVFSNKTVTLINITAPNALLQLNAAPYSGTYGESILIRFRFLNNTGGIPSDMPSLTSFLLNSTLFSHTSAVGGWYNCTVDTAGRFPMTGNVSFPSVTYFLNFTATYGAYTAKNITRLTLSRIPMTLVLTVDQTSVTAGSSISASATLRYNLGANQSFAPNGLTISFQFIVKYTNGSTGNITKDASILSGVASSSLATAGDMTSITVNATFVQDYFRLNATALSSEVLVTPPPPFPTMLVVLAGGGTGAIIIGAIVAARVRSRRRLREEAKALVLRQTASLARLIVVHLASGRSVFSRSLGTEEAVDPNLISGFLSANQSILQEVFQKKTGAGLRFADYGEYKVVSHLGNYVMATLFCTEAAGEELRSVLEQFSEKFEKKYSKTLEAWDGDMEAFKDADAVADEYFSLPLCSPYVVVGEDFTHRRLSGDERKVIEEAQRLSAGRGFFFITLIIDFLLTKQGMKRSKTVEVIRSLTNRGIFRQVTVDEAAELGRVQQEASTQP
ncbi:MAG: hypothetical protein WED05_06705 [Candidatus Atabeyarchaeum deiterrae]